MPVIFQKDDGYIKLYSMSGSAVGSELTPSAGWIFVEDIRLSVRVENVKSHKIGATSRRTTAIAEDIVLSIGRIHTGGSYEAFDLADDPNLNYAIEVLYYDTAEGETESSAYVKGLKFCKTIERTLATGRPANTVNRQWTVEEMQDSAFT